MAFAHEHIPLVLRYLVSNKQQFRRSYHAEF
ncbi:hypothetical protein VPHK482G1_0014 [Vibrio phage K482 g1]